MIQQNSAELTIHIFKTVKYLIFSLMLIFSVIQTQRLAAENLSLPGVVDNANFLTAEEKAKLESKIVSMRNQYAFDCLILTVNDTGEKSLRAYADDYYDNAGYGIGNNADGIILLHVQSTRDVYVSGSGKGITLFNSKRMNKAFDKMGPFVRDNLYGDAYMAFLEETEKYLGGSKTILYIIGGAISLFISLAAFFISKSKYKTVQPQQFASNYIKQGSQVFTRRNDIFVSTSTTRTVKKSSSSSGGSHLSSSGRSHSGGGRRF